MKTTSEKSGPITPALRPFPLRKASDYERALTMLEPLVSRARLNREERDFLEIMAALVEKYEDEHLPVGESGVSGVAVLRHLLEANRLTGADLGRILGTRTQGYPILRGERELTKTHMLKLAAYFNVPPGVFFGVPARGDLAA